MTLQLGQPRGVNSGKQNGLGNRPTQGKKKCGSEIEGVAGEWVRGFSQWYSRYRFNNVTQRSTDRYRLIVDSAIASQAKWPIARLRPSIPK